MEIFLDPAVWLCLGLLLMAAELVLPGGVVIFLGGGCVIVALAIWAGLVDTWVLALTVYFVANLILLFGLRSFFLRFAEGDSSVANTEELLDELDARVDVVETIGPGDHPGRILFRDTQWAALGNGDEINPGEQVRIIARENVTYVVARVVARF